MTDLQGLLVEPESSILSILEPLQTQTHANIDTHTNTRPEAEEKLLPDASPPADRRMLAVLNRGYPPSVSSGLTPPTWALLEWTDIISLEELRTEERRHSISRWQQQWDAAEKGRWTHCLMPQIDVCLNRNHGKVNCYLIQMLSGHGCFRAYLHHFKHNDSSDCPSYLEVIKDAEHVLFVCLHFNLQRDELEKIPNQRLQAETLVEAMLSSKLPGTLPTLESAYLYVLFEEGDRCGETDGKIKKKEKKTRDLWIKEERELQLGTGLISALATGSGSALVLRFS
ncbi:hypothetical protein EVAR_74400_1 [Eumeta japonica]|uniref:Uncharacterized protein n=1 Tax=Eumeta variegata TaxID=151549 RepID=A0A4C1SD68_EUMVA|nr:hypothetical protein EVAR_74400_1 [Eumeta japonica]